MFGKRPKHRVFDYEPRYYDQANDPIEKRKKRLKFRSHISAKRKTRSPIFWLLLFAAVVFLYLKFSGQI